MGTVFHCLRFSFLFLSHHRTATVTCPFHVSVMCNHAHREETEFQGSQRVVSVAGSVETIAKPGGGQKEGRGPENL